MSSEPGGLPPQLGTLPGVGEEELYVYIFSGGAEKSCVCVSVFWGGGWVKNKRGNQRPISLSYPSVTSDSN